MLQYGFSVSCSKLSSVTKSSRQTRSSAENLTAVTPDKKLQNIRSTLLLNDQQNNDSKNNNSTLQTRKDHPNNDTNNNTNNSTTVASTITNSTSGEYNNKNNNNPGSKLMTTKTKKKKRRIKEDKNPALPRNLKQATTNEEEHAKNMHTRKRNKVVNQKEQSCNTNFFTSTRCSSSAAATGDDEENDINPDHENCIYDSDETHQTLQEGEGHLSFRNRPIERLFASTEEAKETQEKEVTKTYFGLTENPRIYHFKDVIYDTVKRCLWCQKKINECHEIRYGDYCVASVAEYYNRNKEKSTKDGCRRVYMNAYKQILSVKIWEFEGRFKANTNTRLPDCMRKNSLHSAIALVTFDQKKEAYLHKIMMK